MSLRFLIDMNLCPAWQHFLRDNGIDATHWSEIGASTAADHIIMGYAATNKLAVLTHDLDFGSLLAMTKASSPSVIMLRSQSTSIQDIGRRVVRVIEMHVDELISGALIVLDLDKLRMRLLPLTPEAN